MKKLFLLCVEAALVGLLFAQARGLATQKHGTDTLQKISAEIRIDEALKSDVYAIAFSPDGNYLCAGDITTIKSAFGTPSVAAS